MYGRVYMCVGHKDWYALMELVFIFVTELDVSIYIYLNVERWVC